VAAGSPEKQTGPSTNPNASSPSAESTGAAVATVSEAEATNAPIRLYARSGSKMRIEGTSNIHDWQMENPLIQGAVEAGSNFPTGSGRTVVPGRVKAQADILVSVKGFRSLKKDGSLYDSAMDDRMSQALQADTHPKILFHLTDLVVKEVPKTKDAPYLLEARGDLAVAGVTNNVSLPLTVLPLGQGKLKISGTAAVKMTDFKIEPPTKLGVFTTGDDVKLLFDWMVGPRTAPAAVSASK
jgi:hypothetical protein